MKPHPILLPLSFVYGAVVALRNVFFEKHLYRTASVPVPVISVGNMTTGGTGKTPIVERIASLLQGAGKRVAVVSRGYRRLSTGFVLVSDGSTITSTADASGDEAYQLAKSLAGVVIITDEDRAHGAMHAVNRLACDVVVLDDGFQHRALRRDLDIVLIDATSDPFSMPMLPAGHRREPLSGLGRADCVIITKCTAQMDSEAIAKRIGRYTGAPVFTSSYEPAALVDCRTGGSVDASLPGTQQAVAFCGIGQPDSFKRSLEAFGVRCSSFHAYADHHRYSAQELNDIARKAAGTGAGYVVTTEKDARRLDGVFDPGVPLVYLKMHAEIHDHERFSQLIFSCFHAQRQTARR